MVATLRSNQRSLPRRENRHWVVGDNRRSPSQISPAVWVGLGKPERSRAYRHSFEHRPAVFEAPRALRAGVVQQTLAYVPPDRVLTVEPGRVGSLDPDGPAAA